ncbi:MAG: YbaB/EbfC family nucleoid-associated protein [Anaplasmataceae bacterium]|nr:YbaB/EbfC family nucleoid-associated protein [Anaplasmataceae bacterium]
MARNIYQPTTNDRNYSGVSTNNDLTVNIDHKFHITSIIASDELLNKPLDIDYITTELQIVLNNTLTSIEDDVKNLFNKNDDYKKKLMDMTSSLLGKEILDKISHSIGNENIAENKIEEKEYIGSAGADNIIVTINNKFIVKSIKINEEYDLSILLDLIKSAFNNAIKLIVESMMQ